MRPLLHRARGLAPCGALLLALLMGLLGGCATQTHSLLQQPPAGLPPHAELAATPFYPQERYQCGPASLAMALSSAGIARTPDELVPQVYIPQREGSLQPEMLAAARRNGAVAVPIPPRLDALLQELAAGNPVIVLQNLSLPVAPVWHYAVAIGYDMNRGELVLRSGTTEREVMALSTFEHTWDRGGDWGMLALPPGRLPATVGQAEFTDALVAFEKASKPAAAHAAYAAALQRWPDDLTLQLGAGNTAYAAGDKAAAAEAYRRAAASHPDSAPALNNLATVLAELGRYDEAHAAAVRAVALGGTWSAASRATLQSIEAAQKSGR